MKTTRYHKDFLQSDREHILMLTIHGVHEWNVVPGYRDTGGQNVFVNQLSAALAKSGYKITIANRGGYPHPRSGQLQTGLHYHDYHQRILYVEDGSQLFVRKEDMGEHFPVLVKTLKNYLHEEGSPIDIIISHYWDGGILGCMIKEELGLDAKHIWVPHSLGRVKRRNVSQREYENLRLHDRIRFEDEVFQKVNFVAATSNIIKASSKEDYGYLGKLLWLPPCVDQKRFFPRPVDKSDRVWSLLSRSVNLPAGEIQGKKIITEISRTDRTKQKDILIKSFSRVLDNHPETLLVVSIDYENKELSSELRKLIIECGVEHATAAVGSVWDILPKIYAISDIYCTPSIMEGFGMSVQEAAATQVPVVSSDLVPFVTEYLATDSKIIKLTSGGEILEGKGAFVVPPGNIDGFVFALDELLSDKNLRKKMGENAYLATIPYFTWDHIVEDFISKLDS